MPPLQDGDPYRSMSVVPYLEDLHSPESGSTSLIDEDETAGTETLCVPGMKASLSKKQLDWLATNTDDITTQSHSCFSCSTECGHLFNSIIHIFRRRGTTWY
jgi:hypothetical protein